MGIGVDVHPLVAGVPLWLAGLHWPDEPAGCAGHSDGDVAAHAACDALLSAAGLGDLGAVFGTDRSGVGGCLGVNLLAEAPTWCSRLAMRSATSRFRSLATDRSVGSRRDEAEAALVRPCGAPVSVRRRRPMDSVHRSR